MSWAHLRKTQNCSYYESPFQVRGVLFKWKNGTPVPTMRYWLERPLIWFGRVLKGTRGHSAT